MSATVEWPSDLMRQDVKTEAIQHPFYTLLCKAKKAVAAYLDLHGQYWHLHSFLVILRGSSCQKMTLKLKSGRYTLSVSKGGGEISPSLTW